MPRRELHDAAEVLVAHETGRPRVLTRDAEEISRSVRAPQVADAIGAERERDACGVHLVQGQLRHAQRCDGRHGDSEIPHALEQVVAPRRRELCDGEPVGDVDALLEPEAFDAIEDQFDLEGAEVGRVVEMDVDAHAVLGGEGEDRVDLADRVAVDRSRIEPAHMIDARARRGVEEFENARAAEHAVLRERDDLHRQCAVVRGDGLTHDLYAAQPEPEVDVDVRADGRRPVRDELLEHIAGDRRRRHPDLVAPGALMTDPTLGAALAAIGLPRQTPPRLVDVRVRVHEPGKGQQATPVDLAGLHGSARVGIADADDAAVGEDDVLCRAAPRADVADGGRGRRGGAHPSILTRPGSIASRGCAGGEGRAREGRGR